MFGFQVRVKGNPRQGSVCAGPNIGDDGYSYCVVMWDDDYTFSTLEVGHIEAVPNPDMVDTPLAVVEFPGPDDTLN